MADTYSNQQLDLRLSLHTSDMLAVVSVISLDRHCSYASAINYKRIGGYDLNVKQIQWLKSFTVTVEKHEEIYNKRKQNPK